MHRIRHLYGGLPQQAAVFFRCLMTSCQVAARPEPISPFPMARHSHPLADIAHLTMLQG